VGLLSSVIPFEASLLLSFEHFVAPLCILQLQRPATLLLSCIWKDSAPIETYLWINADQTSTLDTDLPYRLWGVCNCVTGLYQGKIVTERFSDDNLRLLGTRHSDYTMFDVIWPGHALLESPKRHKVLIHLSLLMAAFVQYLWSSQWCLNRGVIGSRARRRA
jgi:hypothetical protein